MFGLARGRLGDLTGTSSLARQAASAAGSSGDIAARAETAARANLWARNIAGHPDLVADTLGRSAAQAALAARLNSTASEIARAQGLAAGAHTRSLAEVVEATAVKLSLFGGSLDLFGPSAPTGAAAFDSLFGSWRMRADLPSAFYRDPVARARIYRDADVDAGLVDAANAQVVDLLVESGAVAGRRTGGRAPAVLEIGSIRMTVTAGRARHDAYRAIDGFEIALRAFVGVKLAAACVANGEDPKNWFALRVPGNISGNAQRARRDAYRDGERKGQPLIDFTNLGELITVITSTRNWDDAFGRVFPDRDGFKVDLQRLTAHRRPIMHGRPIDGIRLAEILLVIRRLTALMEADGDWDSGWDDGI